MKYVFYVLGAILLIGGMVMDGLVSWILWAIGLLLCFIASQIGEREVLGETDKTILTLLFYASSVDGELGDEEQKYINQYIKRRGLSNKQVNSVKKNFQDPTKWKYSSDDDQKDRIIDEVVGLIKADNEVTEEEKNFLSIVAKSINYDESKALAKL